MDDHKKYLENLDRTLRSKFIMVPTNVLFNEALKANEKIMLGIITTLSKKMGYCWATNEHFATLLQSRKETVCRWIKALEKEKMIFVQYLGKRRYIGLGRTPDDIFLKEIKKHYKNFLTRK